MQTRPKFFLIYAVIVLMIAASFPVQVAFLAGHNLSEWSEIIYKLTPFNKIVIGLCIACSVLSLRASPLLRVIIPATLLAVAWNNYLVAEAGFGFSMENAKLGIFLFTFIHLPFLAPSARKILTQPHARWWLIPKRHKLDLAVSVRAINGLSFGARTFDISENGTFVKIDPTIFRKKENVLTRNLAEGSRVKIKISFGKYREIGCEAEVVRCTPTLDGRYPSGFGLKFLELSPVIKTEVQRLLALAATVKGAESLSA